MTATRTRRLAPLLIATLLAGGGASLTSTAFAAPAETAASVTTNTDTDSPRPVKSIRKKPRTSGGVGGGGVWGGPDIGGILEGGAGGESYENERMWRTDREMNKVHNEL
ncbi:hypothetical protein [Streptomyces sp. NPDC058412]|uniref:hypothetical protein n=1 Tax=Streptomyces sp. NPDC058412 TaxID=3346486 RepID=UPI0036520BAA